MDEMLPDLGELELEVMQLVWKMGEVTAEQVREELTRNAKESTVRTVLRRLEEKGFVTHRVDGRTFVFRAVQARQQVAARAVRRVVDWFCNGSVDDVLVGMADARMLEPGTLERLEADQGGERPKLMLGIMGEAAIRSLLLAVAVQCAVWLLRVRSARLLLAASTVVMLASLAMPMLQQVTLLRVPVDPAIPTPLIDGASDLLQGPLLQLRGVPGAAGNEVLRQPSSSPWPTAVYLVFTVALLLRIAVGARLSLRLISRAVPIHLHWAREAHVRLSWDVTSPVTVADVILLPVDALDWPADTLHAVLAHEQAHVARRDFMMLIVSQINRALFWFSPLAWWQHRRLVALTELASDDQAIAVSGDHLRYAEILLEMGRRAGPVSQGPAMARPATLSHRIDRILRRQVPSCPTGGVQQAMLLAGVAGLSLAAASTMPHPASQSIMASYSREKDASDGTPQPWGDARRIAGQAPTALPVQQALPIPVAPELGTGHVAEAGSGPSSAVTPQAAAAAGARLPAARTSQQASRRAVRAVSRTTSPLPPVVARTVQEAPDRSRQDTAARPTEPVMEESSPKSDRDGEGSVLRNGAAIDPVQLLPSVGVQPRFPVQTLPPEFAAVIGSTCNGTIAIGQNAQPDKQPSVIAGQLVSARAQFYFRTGGVPWVRFDAFGQQPLDLPLRFTRNGLTWTGEYGIAYTVQASAGSRLTGLASVYRNDSARIDFTCVKSAGGGL